MDRIFLDANILFPAAYLPDSRLRELWNRMKVELVTSTYALEEARRNLLAYAPETIPSLEKLIQSIMIVSESQILPISSEVNLPRKDQHILAAAISAGCTHLLTGNARHFGHLFGHTIQGVVIMRPAQYLRR